MDDLKVTNKVSLRVSFRQQVPQARPLHTHPRVTAGEAADNSNGHHHTTAAESIALAHRATRHNTKGERESPSTFSHLDTSHKSKTLD